MSLALIGVLLGIVLLVFLSFKGVNIILIGPIAAILIILTNGMSLKTALLGTSNSYMFGMGIFLIKYLPIFVLGALLGKYLEDSKATVTIANSILKLTGKNNSFIVLVAITLITAILTYGGVSLFIVIFTVVALTRPIFREMNIPWHLVIIPMLLGGTTFTMTMIPGTPSIQNIIPTSLGTTLTAAPLMGIICSLVTLASGLAYMKWQINKAAAAGEIYVETGQIIGAAVKQEDLPPLTLAILPLVVLIILIFVGSAMKISDVILPVLLIAVVVAAVGLFKYIPNQLATLNAGAVNSIMPLIFTAAAVGVGSVVTGAPGFKVLLDAIQGLPGGPLVQVISITGILSMVTASPSGALGIVIPAFGKAWLATGLNPVVIHRVAAITSAAFAAMPHSGFIFSCMVVFGLGHKQIYKHLFFIGFVGAALALVAAVLMSPLY